MGHIDPYTATTIVNDPTGEVYGIPTFRWGCAPRDLYATRRQLAAIGLRKGGRDPDAIMVRPRAHNPVTYLYRISECVPRRTWTPAWQAAVLTAARSRYRCDDCTRTWPAIQYIPREGVCEDCRCAPATTRKAA